jgi:hypothetical protein
VVVSAAGPSTSQRTSRGGHVPERALNPLVKREITSTASPKSQTACVGQPRFGFGGPQSEMMPRPRDRADTRRGRSERPTIACRAEAQRSGNSLRVESCGQTAQRLTTAARTIDKAGVARRMDPRSAGYSLRSFALRHLLNLSLMEKATTDYSLRSTQWSRLLLVCKRPALCGVAPAISNAIYHATGRFRTLPIRLDDFHATLARSRGV